MEQQPVSNPLCINAFHRRNIPSAQNICWMSTVQTDLFTYTHLHSTPSCPGMYHLAILLVYKTSTVSWGIILTSSISSNTLPLPLQCPCPFAPYYLWNPSLQQANPNKHLFNGFAQYPCDIVSTARLSSTKTSPRKLSSFIHGSQSNTSQCSNFCLNHQFMPTLRCSLQTDPQSRREGNVFQLAKNRKIDTPIHTLLTLP